ncbi:MAG: hypothetical protein GOV00_03665 [Candidatus Altiarchaeota archaeon]|nr:hypothetical protein [Candidatus Altiarchaeota archaeon]
MAYNGEDIRNRYDLDDVCCDAVKVADQLLNDAFRNERKVSEALGAKQSVRMFERQKEIELSINYQ